MKRNCLKNLRNYITNNQIDSNCLKGICLLNTLIEEVDHWLLIMEDTYTHCENTPGIALKTFLVAKK